ncbi:PRC-barrel domain-containing protein [Cognatishimia sp. F0-27]|uniref:PRC-barrel domain-containing protein n=1 Tax=Cognatishimia sp. F0-27 TaxID=2816855 RepID=UPI001D0C1E8A|nr:PRC-barrel domain-containing protein [Cognatishimia sp. F0-27]MCC1492506.1 PRC-barrel domain-containing protein [Cognatishimia sp. F0-27]
MKPLLASTALALAISLPAYAQTANINEESFQPEFEAQQYRGTDLIGATLWQTEKSIDVAATTTDPEELEWDMAGEINDVIIGKDGEVDHIIAAVGGFLGLGQKEISISMDALTFISDGAEADEYFIVFNGPTDMLKDAPDYQEAEQAWKDGQMATGTEVESASAADPMANEDETEGSAYAAQPNMADGDATVTQAANISATGDDAMTASEDTASAETDARAMETETAESDLRTVDTDMTTAGMNAVRASEADITTEDLTGARVYTAGDEWVGEVGELILADDGTSIEKAVIDVGGFLGLGEKPVAVDLDALMIEETASGEIARVSLDMPRSELEAAEPYSEG